MNLPCEILDEITFFCIQNDLQQEGLLYHSFSSRNFLKYAGFDDDHVLHLINLFLKSLRFKDFVSSLFYRDLYVCTNETLPSSLVCLLIGNLRLNYPFFDLHPVPSVKKLWFLVHKNFTKSANAFEKEFTIFVLSIFQKSSTYVIEHGWYEIIFYATNTGNFLGTEKALCLAELFGIKYISRMLD